MEKTPIKATPEPKALFETEDYRVDVIELTETPNMPLPFKGMARRYAVSHKRDKVIGAIIEQLPGAIGAALALQAGLAEALDAAKAGEVPGEGRGRRSPPGFGGAGGQKPPLLS